MRADAPSRSKRVPAPTAAIPTWFWQLASGTHPVDLAGLDEASYTSRALGRWYQFGAATLQLVRIACRMPETEAGGPRPHPSYAGSGERQDLRDPRQADGILPGLVGGPQPRGHGRGGGDADTSDDVFLDRVRRTFVSVRAAAERVCRDLELRGIQIPLDEGQRRGGLEAAINMAGDRAPGTASAHAGESFAGDVLGGLELGLDTHGRSPAYWLLRIATCLRSLVTHSRGLLASNRARFGIGCFRQNPRTQNQAARCQASVCANRARGRHYVFDVLSKEFTFADAHLAMLYAHLRHSVQDVARCAEGS